MPPVATWLERRPARYVPPVNAASTTFPGLAASVPAARRFVRQTLESWSLPAAYEAAEMLVSEVVTNAVLHAHSEFTVEVLTTGDVVRISVTDLSRVMPKQRAYGTDATTGRGLRLVATLAVSWGVASLVDGKTVWFEVRASGDADRVEEPWETETDLDALLAGFDDLDGEGAAPLAPRALAARRCAVFATRSAA